jgi:hypothetical protein
MENERMPDDSATQVVSHEPAQASIFVTRESFHVLQRQNAVDILRRWAAGETLKQIAQSLLVSPAAITQWLDRNVTKEDREQARELHYQTKLDEGLESIEEAADDMNLARAREPYLRRLEWRAQTECKRWQPKQQIQHDIGPDLGDLLRDARKRVASPQQTIIEGSIIDVPRGDDAK